MVAAKIFNKQCQIANKGGSSACISFEFLTTPHCKHLTALRQISQNLGLWPIFRYNRSSGERLEIWQALAQDTDRWLELVNAVMKFRFP